MFNTTEIKRFIAYIFLIPLVFVSIMGLHGSLVFDGALDEYTCAFDQQKNVCNSTEHMSDLEFGFSAHRTLVGLVGMLILLALLGAILTGPKINFTRGSIIESAIPPNSIPFFISQGTLQPLL